MFTLTSSKVIINTNCQHTVLANITYRHQFYFVHWNQHQVNMLDSFCVHTSTSLPSFNTEQNILMFLDQSHLKQSDKTQNDWRCYFTIHSVSLECDRCLATDWQRLCCCEGTKSRGCCQLTSACVSSLVRSQWWQPSSLRLLLPLTARS